MMHLLLHDMQLHDVQERCCMNVMTAVCLLLLLPPTTIELQVEFCSAVSLLVLVVIAATACMLLNVGLQVITASTGMS